MTRDQAEKIALEAFVWLAGHEDLAGVFLGATGASAEDLRTRAADPAFLQSVLDFMTMDDEWVVAFCDSSGHGYEQPLRARQVLEGPGQEGWSA